VERNVLTVRAERLSHIPDAANAVASERRWGGVFSRQLVLGDAVDTKRVDADYTRRQLSISTANGSSLRRSTNCGRPPTATTAPRRPNGIGNQSMAGLANRCEERVSHAIRKLAEPIWVRRVARAG
jgi:hypothetical protein